MKAIVSPHVPVEVISRFFTLLIYTCLHVPAIRGFCLGKQQACTGRSVGSGLDRPGAPQLFHSRLSDPGPRVLAILSSIAKPGMLRRNRTS